MKQKDKQSLRAQNIKELLAQAKTLEIDIQDRRLKRLTQPSKNVREIKLLRQRLAVIKTIVRYKALKEKHL